jgi:hypothetical protein
MLSVRNDAGEKLSYDRNGSSLTVEFSQVGSPEWIEMLLTMEVTLKSDFNGRLDI